MALTRPLRLRTQIAKAPVGASATDLPIARVWVDNGIYHLDSHFDYLVPELLSEQVRIGIRVTVPFAGKEVEGLIIDRLALSQVGKLRSISSILSPHRVANAHTINLIAAVAKRWAAHPYDIIRSAIPPRLAGVDKSFTSKKSHNDNDAPISPQKIRRSYLLFAPRIDPLESLATYAIDSHSAGGVLVLLPEERELQRLEKILLERNVTFTRLDAALPRADRYLRHLQIIDGASNFVIGTRSAIFAPVANLQTIIVYREGAHSHYEVRSPGWNVRDVAIMRSMQEGLSLLLAGYSPSSEAARLIELKWLGYSQSKKRIPVTSFSQPNGELLPERVFAPIRAALKLGPVLFLVPRKGYASALLCKKCRNVALCACGGKLRKLSSSLAPMCSHCSTTFAGWKCVWCQGDTPYLIGRGADRFAEEIGRAFPNLPVIASAGENILRDIPDAPALVISTSGAQPRPANGYSAVVLLEGSAFFGEVDMRAQERSREAFFYSASLISETGQVLVVLAESHPIVSGLALWNPTTAIGRELREREDTHLPPYFRCAILELDEMDALSVASGFKKALLAGRLPASTRILGPSIANSAVARILITASLSDGAELVEVLHEFQRRRGISKKKLVTLRIDPYSLSQ